MNEEVIRKIVRQIFSDPAIKAILQESGAQDTEGTFSSPRKPNCLILLNYVPNPTALLTSLQTQWGSAYTLYLLPSESVGRSELDLPGGLQQINPQDALNGTDWSRILLPACSLNTLAKIALGIRDNPFTELIGRGIVQGILIELSCEYFGLTASTPSTYRDLYTGYLQTVQSYGVRVCPTLAAGSCLGGDRGILHNNDNEAKMQDHLGFSQPLLQEANVLRFTKKYLADKDAVSFPEDSKVLIPQRIVISPLARDTLRIRRIELCQEKER